MSESGTEDGPAAMPQATEADVAEQRTPVEAEGYAGAAAPVPTTDVEAAEGDLVEQSIAVPLDEDEQR